MRYRSYVKDVTEFKNTVGNYEQGMNKNFIFGKETFGTPLMVVLLDARI